MNMYGRFLFCIVLFLLTALFSVDQVVAQVRSQNDCVWFANVDPQLRPQVVQQRIEQFEKPPLTIFTDQDLFMALVHLQNYCCDDWQSSEAHCSQTMKVSRRRYPESPFIVDQLMFVGMKKLDWVRDDCNRLGIDCVTRSYEVDPVERRDTITEIAENTKWYPPSYIYENFRRTWIWSEDMNDIIDLNTPTMAKSYWAMCNDLATLRFVTWLQWWSIDALTTWWRSIEQLCLERIKLRFIQEENYVKSLQIEKWTQYFSDNLKAYLYDYYIDTRLAWLMSKYTALDSCFQTILRYVQKTSCCNL
jgi:hypothetical protein